MCVCVCVYMTMLLIWWGHFYLCYIPIHCVTKWAPFIFASCSLYSYPCCIFYAFLWKKIKNGESSFLFVFSPFHINMQLINRFLFHSVISVLLGNTSKSWTRRGYAFYIINHLLKYKSSECTWSKIMKQSMNSSYWLWLPIITDNVPSTTSLICGTNIHIHTALNI